MAINIIKEPNPKPGTVSDAGTVPGTSAVAYLGDLIPALASETGRKITGIVLLTFFLIVNLLGVDIMARIQKLMVWLLIAALVVFAVIGIFHLELPIFNFADLNFMVNGPGNKLKTDRLPEDLWAQCFFVTLH